MFDQIVTIANLIIESFLHTWPYLLVTIPLAVAVRMSGASKYINRAFQARPIIAIFLATAVGAFSPFCSCGVVPVVAALLIGGVPLAPVMSFWIASPSMDPEIFFLSAATIGWELAVWRLGSTLALSLSAGLVTHLAVQRGWLGQSILRTQRTTSARTIWGSVQAGWRGLWHGLTTLLVLRPGPVGAALSPAVACCGATTDTGLLESRQLALAAAPAAASSCGTSCARTERANHVVTEPGSCGSGQDSSCSIERGSFWRRLLNETWSATWMVVKFMTLAFLLTALIKLYVPAEWVAGLLGAQNPLAIPTAAILGVPVYASNLTALPMVSALLAQGMNPSAALAFLISGPITTLPAMAAVWGLASRRVFALYVLLALLGAVALGYLHGLVQALL
jgi:uncharacterized membrane protein YraQ (UPF0718 family)